MSLVDNGKYKKVALAKRRAVAKTTIKSRINLLELKPSEDGVFDFQLDLILS